jgi:hypothetical protein
MPSHNGSTDGVNDPIRVVIVDDHPDIAGSNCGWRTFSSTGVRPRVT